MLIFNYPSKKALKDAIQMIIRCENEIDTLRARENQVIEAIKAAFGDKPISCDGTILVSVAAYNRIVDAFST